MENRTQRMRCFTLTAVIVLTAACGLLFGEDIPRDISDTEFWRMITEFSEPGGTFPQQYMSNEDSAQFVIPALKESPRQLGAYLGVGLEQNFTYIAAIQPKIAFIIDIRRDNMIEHLVYKALFEFSPDRADFVSHLFSRKRPTGLNATSSVQALFDAYQAVPADPGIFEDNQRAVLSLLVVAHKFPLDDADREAVTRVLNAFRVASPATLRGQGDNTNPTYSQLMTATDLNGRRQGFLASEDTYRMLKEFEKRNLIVPLVGDFAGSKAIASVGKYLADRNAVVDVFYLSNVERYLFEQNDDAKRFYGNVSTLPLGQSSTFIRSVTSDISRRLGIPIPDGPAKWRSFLSPIRDNLKAFDAGSFQSYTDIFKVSR